MTDTHGNRDHYYRRYGLDGDPFPVAEPDRVLFLTPELEHRLQTLREWIRSDRPLLVVTAPHGGGKTRLSRQLDAVGDDDWLIARIRALPDHDPDLLAETLLARAFPEQTVAADNPSERLRSGLRLAAATGRRPVFVIDDAHCLPAATLAVLPDWLSLRHDDTRIHFILFGEEQLRDRLQELQPALPDDGAAYLQLPALTGVQTGEYIRHRILSYGHIRNDPFSEAALARIHEVSGGLPGGIHHLAREAMQAPAPPKRGGRSLAIAAAALLLLAAGWHFRDALPPPGTSPGQTPVAAADTAPPAPGSAAIPDASELEPDRGAANNTPPEKTATVSIDPDDPEDNGMEPLQPATAATGSAPEAATGAAPPEANPNTAAGPARSPDSGKGENKNARPAASPLTGPEEAPAPPAQAEAGTGNRRSVADTGTAPRHDNVFDLERTPDWAGRVRGEDWLRRQDPDWVALQLISAGRLHNVAKLVQAAPGPEHEFSGFTNYTPSGQPRYRLYYGLYPDSDSAAAAAESLPPALRRLQPWPRPLRAIIAELDDKRKRFGEEN